MVLWYDQPDVTHMIKIYFITLMLFYCALKKTTITTLHYYYYYYKKFRKKKCKINIKRQLRQWMTIIYIRKRTTMKNALFKTSCLFKCVYICSLNVFLTRRKRSVMTLKIIIKGKKCLYFRTTYNRTCINNTRDKNQQKWQSEWETCGDNVK